MTKVNKLDISGQPPKSYDGPVLEDFVSEKTRERCGMSRPDSEPLEIPQGVRDTLGKKAKVRRLQKEFEQEPLKSALKDHLNPKK